MNKEDAISTLDDFKHRLTGEVVNAYCSRGTSFGDDRFNAWRKKITSFLSENFPSLVSVLDEKLTHYIYSIGNETDLEVFWREDGKAMESFIDSLILDIENDEFNLDIATKKINRKTKMTELDKRKVFIGKLGFSPIILHEQASRGKTIIEKIEEYTDVGFAIVLYTADD